MPVKELRVSWVVDTDLFARFLAREHKAMHIDAMQNAVQETEFVSDMEQEPLRLTHTKKARKRGGMAPLILKAMAVAPKQRMNTKEIAGVLIAARYSELSMPNQLYTLKTNKLVRHLSTGLYVITAKGLEYVKAH